MVDLQPHNIKAYMEAKQFLEKYGKAAIVQATGTGKSYVIMQILHDYNNAEKLLVTPSVDIITQFKENPYWTGHKIKCVTYQKLAMMYKNGEINKDLLGDIKLIVIDELHRAGAEKWEAAIKEIIRLYPNAKLLGASATPIRYLDNYRDMVDELFDGHYASNLTLGDALIQNILPMPTYISSLYTIKEEINKRIDRINKIKDTRKSKGLIDELKKIKIEWESTLGVDKIIKRHIMHNNKTYKVAVFCSSIGRLEAFKPEIKNWFTLAFPNKKINIYTYHSKGRNHNIQFQRFKSVKDNNINILLVVNKLNEGIHIDGLNAIIMLRKTSSNIIYQQQLGRVLSVSGYEQPVVIDLVNNCNGIGAISSFWRHVGSEIKSKEDREYKRKGVVVHVHEYLKDTIKILKEVDNKISIPSKVLMEAVERAVKNGEDINSLSDRRLQAFVRLMINSSKNTIYNQGYAKRLLELGASESIRDDWTQKEDNIIINNVNNMSRKDLAKLLPNRSIGAINARVYKLGLVKMKEWTEKEDAIVKKYYAKEGKSTAKRLHGRTEVAVACRAAKLGVEYQYNKQWTDDEDNIIRNYYPKEGADIIRLLPNRTRSGIKTRAEKLGVRVVGRNWTDEEDEILKKYYPKEGMEIVKRLKRSLEAVRNRAKVLGIKYIGNDTWTTEMDKIIINRYGELGLGVSNIMPKPVSDYSIKKRARELGVKYNNPRTWEEQEIMILKQYYPYEGTKVTNRLPNRNKNSVAAKARSLGLKSMVR